MGDEGLVPGLQPRPGSAVRLRQPRGKTASASSPPGRQGGQPYPLTTKKELDYTEDWLLMSHQEGRLVLSSAGGLASFLEKTE